MNHHVHRYVLYDHAEKAVVEARTRHVRVTPSAQHANVPTEHQEQCCAPIRACARAPTATAPRISAPKCAGCPVLCRRTTRSSLHYSRSTSRPAQSEMGGGKFTAYLALWPSQLTRLQRLQRVSVGDLGDALARQYVRHVDGPALHQLAVLTRDARGRCEGRLSARAARATTAQAGPDSTFRRQ